MTDIDGLRAKLAAGDYRAAWCRRRLEVRGALGERCDEACGVREEQGRLGFGGEA